MLYKRRFICRFTLVSNLGVVSIIFFLSRIPDCNYAYNYSAQQRYLLQPQKSVVVKISPTQRENADTMNWYLNEKVMPRVNSSPHLGLVRSTSLKKTCLDTIENNIKKARRTAYSLMSLGFHGENGLDPESSIHIYRTFVLPLLTYGSEVLCPKPNCVQLLERFQKKLLKQIMSLPTQTADSAIYVLSGLLPVQALIHNKILTFFYSICLLADDAIEKRLAYRQLLMKDQNSSSWYIEVKKVLFMYDLPDPHILLNQPYSKQKWKQISKEAVHKYWTEDISFSAKRSESLSHLNSSMFHPYRLHPMLKLQQFINTEIHKLSVKLKLVTDTYILQWHRSKFRKSKTDICLLCEEEIETRIHFILLCPVLEPIRSNTIKSMSQLYERLTEQKFNSLSDFEKLQLILDASVYIDVTEIDVTTIYECFEALSRRLCYSLHCARVKYLNSGPR